MTRFRRHRLRLHAGALAALTLALVLSVGAGATNPPKPPPNLPRQAVSGSEIDITQLAGPETEGTIAIDQADPTKLFAAYNTSSGDDQWMYSTDSGQSWSASTGIPTSCCDNVAASDHYGNIFLTNLPASIDSVPLYISTDGGATFTLLTTLDTGNDLDQPTLSVADNHVWVMWNNNGTLYASGASVNGLGDVGTFSAAHVIADSQGSSNLPTRSHLGAAAQTSPTNEQPVPGSNSLGGQFGGIAVGPTGQVVVDWQTAQSDPHKCPCAIYVNTDMTGTAGTFGNAVKVTNINVPKWDAIPPQPNRTVDAEANVVYDNSHDAYRGRLYLAYTDAPSDTSADTDIYVRYSNDNGATWSSAVKVNDDGSGHTQFFPSLSVDPVTGQLVVAWLDTRNSDDNTQTQEFLAVSTDGGQTFGTNLQVSSGQSDAATGGDGANDFGDYQSVDAYAGKAFPIWPDNSDSNGDNPDSQFDMFTSQISLPLGATNAIVNDPSCDQNVLDANDDGSVDGAVPLGFNVNFFGQPFSAAYVNNNGNITFDQPLATYTPFGLQGTATQIIAPFFGDVDTRGAGSGLLHYGTIPANSDSLVGNHQAFCVIWPAVGYYGDHTDKLNTFQLLLINRSDTGAGNFDIEFNYGSLQWETGDASGGSDGFGGSPAHMGYSNGVDTSFEWPGSGTAGAFLDSNGTTGLIYNSNNSQVAGRYVFPVRNGAATGHAISGTIYANDTNHTLQGAWIQACPTPRDTPCRTTYSGADGTYQFVNLPDSTSGGGAVDHSWTLQINPPGGSDLNPAQLGPVPVAGSDVTGEDATLAGPQPLPTGASVSSQTFGMEDSGVPTVYWGEPFTVTITGCAGGTGTATVHVNQDGYEQQVPLVETDTPGVYTATFASLYPHHGDSSMSWSLSCGTNDGFDMYIDPSGYVKTTTGQPIQGATVTLYRADDADGPFTVVPDGSAIMSPSNQANPDTTDDTGHFGWDVVAGYYKVRAEKAGCTAPGGADSYVESSVLTVPPPVTNLLLTLECSSNGPDTTIDTEPKNPAKTTDATFTFHSSAGGATYECQLDTVVWSACTSPQTYNGLSPHSHVFRVRSTDAGNVDTTPATYGWTIGKLPSAKITGKPAALTSNPDASFTFSSKDPDAIFFCSLDGGAFAECSSPAVYPGLADGKHTFALNAGGGKSAVKVNWTIDATAPDTTIVKGPTAASGGSTTKTVATFKISANEKATTFKCSLDGAAFKKCGAAASYKKLAVGAHTFQAEATDRAGNTDATPAEWDWTITG